MKRKRKMEEEQSFGAVCSKRYPPATHLVSASAVKLKKGI
jgi:hypothetical protein